MNPKNHPPTQLLALLCVALLCALTLTLSGCAKSTAKATATLPPTPPPAATPAVPPTEAAPPAASVPADYWPTDDWRSSTPAEQGMDGEKIAQLLAAIGEQKLGFHGLLIIRHGYIVSETYFGYYQQDTPHMMYSVTKSFISTLVGIALDKGYIDSTSQRGVDFFPNDKFGNLDEQKQAMTLEDILTMRTGLDWDEGDAAYNSLYRSPDWVQYMLDLPMAAAPGTQFLYCSGCSHLLSAIVQQTTGKNPRDFAEENLFKPLGMKGVNWENNPAGIPIGGWGLNLAPRDMARLGYLFLHGGQWDGQQVVSAGWVAEATRSHTGTGGALGYGYQWWTHPGLKAYMALGLYGQMIMVIPEADLIVVTTAQMDNHDEIFKLIEEYVVPAVK
jgi:CubicO group peptidase (beta-lactamase class C family)